MTCGARHAEAAQDLGDAVQVAAAQRGAGEAALQRAEAGEVERGDGAPGSRRRARRCAAGGGGAPRRLSADVGARGRARAGRHDRAVGALGERVHPRVQRREHRLVVVGRGARARAAGRPSAPSRRRRCARRSAPWCAGRGSGRGWRRRRRAATAPGRRTRRAPGRRGRRAARPAARPPRARSAARGRGSPIGSVSRRPSIQPATRPWSWLPPTSTSSRSGPSARPTSSRNAPAGGDRVALRRVAQLDPVAEDDQPVDVRAAPPAAARAARPGGAGPCAWPRRCAGRRRRACARGKAVVDPKA